MLDALALFGAAVDVDPVYAACAEVHAGVEAQVEVVVEAQVDKAVDAEAGVPAGLLHKPRLAVVGDVAVVGQRHIHQLHTHRKAQVPAF